MAISSKIQGIDFIEKIDFMSSCQISCSKRWWGILGNAKKKSTGQSLTKLSIFVL
jgi:hypothetical protein